MEAARVFILTLACIGLFWSGHAQTKGSLDTLLRSFRDVNDDPFAVADTGRSIFIFQTEKNCGKCFEDICDYIAASQHYSGYSVYLVVVMEHNLLALMPQRAMGKKRLHGLRDVLFHFLPGTDFNELYTTPSPQMVIKNGDKIEYYNYSRTLAFSRSH